MRTDQALQVTVLRPEAQRDRVVPIGWQDGSDVLVGRAEACDLRFDDPYLSRVHASLQPRDDGLWVRDLGSSGGTWVNDERITAAVQLHDGDVLTLGRVVLQVSGGEGTRVMPVVDPGAIVSQPQARTRPQPQRPPRTQPQPAATHDVHFDLDDQRAGTINNVGRDQYTAYVHQRESFLREVAATRTRARGLMWTGFVLFALGFGVQIVGMLLYGNSITGAIQKGFNGSGGSGPLDIDVGGFGIAFAGGALASVGAVVFVVGLVLHVVAASRRKRVDREMPMHPHPYARS